MLYHYKLEVIIIIIFAKISFCSAQENIYKTLNAFQCDSLIDANVTNPNFVILDVRTPAEYNPEHLEGAINRNYYEDFDNHLDQFDKEKTYLIHCKSGSRSAGAFTKMQAKNFREVYNMQGGINAWKNAALPTTNTFAPLLMLVSEDTIPVKTIEIGEIDTITISITNRANDTLSFISITELAGTEFETDFEIDTTVLGSFDYTFNIYYEPTDETFDTVIFNLESNGGSGQVLLLRTGLDLSPVLTLNSPSIYDFGNVYIEQTDSFRIELSNSGLSDLFFTEIQCCISPQFSLTFDIDTTISPNGIYDFLSIFSPSEYGLDSMPVMIKSNGGDVSFMLKGNGINQTNFTVDDQLQEFTIYPNPANNYIVIDNNVSGGFIEILSDAGVKILNMMLDSAYPMIDISNLNSGIYFIRLIAENDAVTKKFIVR